MDQPSPQPTNMPGLTVETNSSSSPLQPSNQHSPHSTGRSRSSSPIRPPYSPITPVLGPSRRLATDSDHAAPNPPPTSQQPALRTYTHSQPPQTFVSQPPVPVETISLDSNPDALALRSSISILQIQRQKAIADIQKLQKIKERALNDPSGFAEALTKGEVKTKPDTLFQFSQGYDSDDIDSDDDQEGGENPEMLKEQGDGNSQAKGLSGEDVDMANVVAQNNAQHKVKWPPLPTPQNIVRTPPINWTQYGIIGDSLDKLHADQIARPIDGLPARIGANGQVINVEGGARRSEPVTIAAPFAPGKDKIDKMGTRKGGKR